MRNDCSSERQLQSVAAAQTDLVSTAERYAFNRFSDPVAVEEVRRRAELHHNRIRLRLEDVACSTRDAETAQQMETPSDSVRRLARLLTDLDRYLGSHEGSDRSSQLQKVYLPTHGNPRDWMALREALMTARRAADQMRITLSKNIVRPGPVSIETDQAVLSLIRCWEFVADASPRQSRSNDQQGDGGEFAEWARRTLKSLSPDLDRRIGKSAAPIRQAVRRLMRQGILADVAHKSS